MGAKMKINKTTKGQITIFIILAIAIVFIGGLILYLRNKPGIFGLNEVNPESYMDVCMVKAGQEAITLMSKQGGDVRPENYILYKGQNVSYTCYNKNFYDTCIMQKPMFISYETDEIRNYVSPIVERCFDSLKKEMEKRNYNVEMKDTNFSVVLEPKKVNLIAEKEIKISKNEENIQFDKFKTTLVDPIYNFAEIAQEISNQEARFCNFEYIGYMGLYPQWEISKKDIDGQVKIYNIKEVKTGREFSFAIRSCAMPAGM